MTSPEQQARLARAAIDRADYDTAARILDESLTLFAKRNDSEAVWAMRVMRGEILISRDREAAKTALAFELPPAFRKSETAVQQLVMRAIANVSDKSVALPLIESARSLAAANHLPVLADVYVMMASLDQAHREEYTREGLRLARKNGRRVAEAKAMANFALALAVQERYAESIEWGERAAGLAQSLHLNRVVQTAQGNLGWAYFELGDYETAGDLLTAANETCVRAHIDYDRVAWLVMLGNVRYALRDWEAADRYYREALALGRKVRRDQVGYALANLARVSIERARFAEARTFNAQAMQVKREEEDAEAERNSDIIDAQIATVEGDHARAQKLLENVVRTATRSTTRMDGEASLARLFARTGKTALASTHFQNALEIAHEARADVSNMQLRFSFFNSVARLFDSYVDFLAASNRGEEALAVTEISRAQTLAEGLKARGDARIDARAIAKQNNATILCYWLGRDHSYLWVITPDAVVMRSLPADTIIEKAVEAYRNRLLGPQGSLQSSGQKGEELYTMLVAPAAIPKGSRVIVIAEGKLHTLNFETLVAPSPRHYWIEDVIVMNAGSLQLLTRSATKTANASRMLVVGNTPSPDPSFPRLPHAAAEVRAVAKRFPNATVLEGSAATPAAYKAAGPGKFDYVHFVAHGVATRKRPLDSAVILAPDPTSKSYKLLAREVVEQPLTARLVTISSCHGAGTRTYAGEGVVGLAWAFLRAGADQVIAALWEVSDAATPQLMDDMYGGIRQKRDPAVALRDAKLKLVRSDGVFRYPKYWAPFVIYAGT